MLLRIFSIIFPLFVVVAAGYAYGRWKRPDLVTVNQLNMDLLIPALLLHVLVAEDFRLVEYGALALGGLAVVLGSGLLALPIARFIGAPVKTLVPPMMFNNAGNLGLPLAVFAFGPQALPAALVLFIIQTGLQFTLGMYLMDHRARWFDIFKQPVVLATLVGIGLGVSGYTWPAPVDAALQLLGQAAIPLMLFTLGVRLVGIGWSNWRIGLLGALLCPIAGVSMVLIVQPFLELTAVQSGLLLVFGALPPAVLNFLVAEKYCQEPEKVAAIVMLGHLVSMVFIPLALVFALP